MVRFEDFRQARPVTPPFSGIGAFRFGQRGRLPVPGHLSDHASAGTQRSHRKIGRRRLIDNFWRRTAPALARRQASGPFRARRGTASGHAGLHRRTGNSRTLREAPRRRGIRQPLRLQHASSRPIPPRPTGSGKGSYGISAAQHLDVRGQPLQHHTSTPPAARPHLLAGPRLPQSCR